MNYQKFSSDTNYFVWVDYLAPGMSQTQGDSGYAPVQGYMVVLGNREIGIVSEADGAKPRTVLITREQYQQMFEEGEEQ